jgi:hypothetical protein
MNRVLISMVAALGLAGPGLAWDWYPLSVPEMAANGGATHVALFDYEDFTGAESCWEAFTNAIPAKRSVEFVALKLDTAFERTAATTSSVSLKIGDGSDDDLFLTATELASDGTEVFIKYGPPHGATVTSTATTQTDDFGTALTMQTATITYMGVDFLGYTNTVVTNVLMTVAPAVTNLTIASSASAGELGRKLYAASGSLVFTFTPNLSEPEALADMTAGQVRLYFRVFESTR